MNTDYSDVFSSAGKLAQALEGYAYRPEQAAMAKAVGLALSRLEPLIVEAGTGTGKTFAYLVPALLSGRSVIISTGTRTLQDQLFRRDLPLLAKAIGLPVKIALLKGRANYLCRHRLELAAQQGSLLAPNAAPRACWHGSHAGPPPPKAAIFPSSPTCRSSPPSGPASPRRAKTAWGRSVRSSRTAMCSMRAAMRRPPISWL